MMGSLPELLPRIDPVDAAEIRSFTAMLALRQAIRRGSVDEQTLAAWVAIVEGRASAMPVVREEDL